ncbi:hypothetical protein SHKM778_85020 [Streptomyces sp. KM77-8]|uniref:Uncharacterized protein n=1 Tax=Streptomyces haneummycinicus TaxID=3074435 RepID=A0AAT9HXZ7_9ACTN
MDAEVLGGEAVGAGCRVACARVAGGGEGAPGRGGETAAGSWGTRLGPERWGRAQQPEQRQLQRARAAPRNPAERVGVSAEFASMPTSTAAHSSTVNSATGMWDRVHPIRFISQAKGLLSRFPGHMVPTAGAPRTVAIP